VFLPSCSQLLVSRPNLNLTKIKKSFEPLKYYSLGIKFTKYFELANKSKKFLSSPENPQNDYLTVKSQAFPPISLLMEKQITKIIVGR
jgi:hypothetical protein